MAFIKDLPLADLQKVSEGLKDLAFNGPVLPSRYWTELLAETQSAINALEIETDCCEWCGSFETDPENDPLANWLSAEREPRMAHAQCGEDAGWTLA